MTHVGHGSPLCWWFGGFEPRCAYWMVDGQPPLTSKPTIKTTNRGGFLLSPLACCCCCLRFSGGICISAQNRKSYLCRGPVMMEDWVTPIGFTGGANKRRQTIPRVTSGALLAVSHDVLFVLLCVCFFRPKLPWVTGGPPMHVACPRQPSGYLAMCQTWGANMGGFLFAFPSSPDKQNRVPYITKLTPSKARLCRKLPVVQMGGMWVVLLGSAYIDTKLCVSLPPFDVITFKHQANRVKTK